VKGLGATEVVDYRAKDVKTALKEWCARNGRKFDLVIDNVGSDSSLYWEAHDFLREGGQFVQIGGELSVGGMLELAKKSLWPGFLGGGKRQYEFLGLADKKEDLVDVGRWMAEGKVRAIVEDDNVFDLANAKTAFEKLRSGRIRGKVVVKVIE
jgi:NADPH:quinone reductase-like Zn-dependent oxidoreductase